MLDIPFSNDNAGERPNRPRWIFSLCYLEADRSSHVIRGHEPLWKPGYSPMQQEGAIVLGTGGDNSNGSIGTFYEGAMTRGVTSPGADDAVQRSVLGAAYAVGSR